MLQAARRRSIRSCGSRVTASRRGIADALRTGYLAARGDVLVFYPADLQFKPEDIPRLVAPILAGESDMVTGFKEGKYEKAFVSGIYNRLSRTLFHVPVKDLNSVKAYRREIMDSLPDAPRLAPLHDRHRRGAGIHGHRDPGPAVSASRRQVEVRHCRRIPVGVLDMLAVWFELRFGQKPLLLFGMLGAALFAFERARRPRRARVASSARLGIRPVWTVIQTCLILGSIFFATGLIGEQIAGQRAQLREIRRQLDEHGRRSRATTLDA